MQILFKVLLAAPFLCLLYEEIPFFLCGKMNLLRGEYGDQPWKKLGSLLLTISFSGPDSGGKKKKTAMSRPFYLQ